VERVTTPVVHFGAFGAKGDETDGNSASTMNPACTLAKTELELVDNAGNTTVGPSDSPSETVQLCALFCFNVTRGATISGPKPTGPPNLSMMVHWFYDTGVAVRYRLRYTISQPTGVSCNP